jgi:fibronectin-binding autotransporter adhesin
MTDITGTAPDTTAGPGNDIVVSGTTIGSPDGNVTLQAGDNVVIAADGTVQATATGKTVSIQAGYQDIDGIGAITVDGTFNADMVALAALQDITLHNTARINAKLVDLSAGSSGVIEVVGAKITADTLQSTSGTGSTNLTSTNAIASIGTFTVTTGDFGLVDNVATLTVDGSLTVPGNVTLTNSGNIAVDGSISGNFVLLDSTGGSVTFSGATVTAATLGLFAKGVTEASGNHISAGHLFGFVSGNVTLLDPGNAITALGNLGVTGGDFALTDNVPTLSIDSTVTVTGDISLVNLQAGGTIAHVAATSTQTVTVSGGAGTFTLTFNGQTTAPLAFNASVSAVQAALSSLSSISSAGGLVFVTQSGSTYTVSFGGNLGFNPPLLTATGSGGASVAIAAVGASDVSGHDITLVADQLALDASTITASDAIFLAPTTAGTAVALGDGLSAPFALSNAELATLISPTLTIGADKNGTVTAGAMTIGNASVSSSTLNLFSLGGVTQTVGPFNVGAGSGTVNVTAGGTVRLGNFSAGLVFNAGAIGGSTTSGHFVVMENGAGALTVNDISTAGGEIAIAAAGPGINLNGALHSHGGNIVLNDSLAPILLNGAVDAGNGSVVLFGGGFSETAAGSLSGVNLLTQGFTGSADIALTSASNAITGHVALQAGSNSGNISFTNSTAYTIGGFSGIGFTSLGLTGSTAGAPAISTNATGSVTLTAGGDITQAGGANDYISTGTLNLARLSGANPDVTLDNASNSFGKLGTADLGSGALTLVDAHDLDIAGAVTTGATTITVSGALTLDAPITASGNVTLNAVHLLQTPSGTIDTSAANGDVTLTVTGDPLLVHTIITGSGDVVLNAPAYTILADALDNIGSLTTDAAGGTAIDGGGVTTSGAQTYHDLVRLGADATLVSHTGGVNIDGTLELQGYDLTVSDATTGTFAGVISGDGLFTKAGTGAITLNAANTYTGSTQISAGTLLVDGSIADSLQTLVASGGTLGGHGAVGDVVVQSGGTLAPGDSQSTSSLGVLTTGDVTLNSAAHLAIELGGATPGLYDQLKVHGTVSLDGAVLDGTLFGNFMPTAGESFTVIDNDGTDAVNGTFAGLADGATTNIGGTAFSISYHGGDGNDVTLTAAAVQQAPQPIIGTDSDDTFTAPAGDSEFIGLRGVDTINFNFRLVDATVTYSGYDTIIDGPNGSSHTITTGFETFVFTDGTVNDRDGSPLIDDLFYYSRNHDVWNAHMDADTHFNLYGWREGRDPNAWFDTKGYLAHYTDVAAAGINPLTHYDQYGWHEGRDPSTAFDTKQYLAQYGDVAANGVDPLAHFLTWQGEEGRHAFGDGVWA